MIAEGTLLACVIKHFVKINFLMGRFSIPCPTKEFDQGRASLMYNYGPLSLMKSNLILFSLTRPARVPLFPIHSKPFQSFDIVTFLQNRLANGSLIVFRRVKKIGC